MSAEPSGTEYPILVRNVSKKFSRQTGAEKFLRRKTETRAVLTDANLSVAKSEMVCVLGRNGSGKTTLVKMLSALIFPDTGSVKVCGWDTKSHGREVRRRIGVVLNAGDAGFQPRLSGPDNLEYYGVLYGLTLKESRKRVRLLLDDFGLEDRGLDMYQSYTSGMRRRLALARALLPDPAVLLLDEPTLGVDPWSTEHIHEKLVKLGKNGKTILVTTNNFSEAKTLGTRIVTLENGMVSPAQEKQKVALQVA